MKLRNKKTGVIKEIVVMPVVCGYPDEFQIVEGETSLEDFNEIWEDYNPKELNEPLIKDKNIRKAVRAWADVNEIVKAFVVMNEHMNWTVYGDDVDRNRFSIEFFDRVVSENDETKNYTIDDLCGTPPEPLEPTFIDLDERIKEKEKE